MRIGVVGAGTAGCASCLFLERAGHDVTLFERVDEPAPVGAGLLLQPTGMSVLAELGLLESILARGARVDALIGDTARGRAIMDLRYGEIRPGLFALGVHRGLLFRTLFDALPCAVRCGVDITRVDDDHLVDSTGARHGPFDRIVVADGARSQLRAASSLVTRARPYEWAALWFIGPDTAGHFTGALSQVYRGTRELIGFLPTGGIDGPPLVSMFWSIRADRVQAWRDAGIDAWKCDVRALTDRAEPILEQIQDHDQLIYAAYQDVVLRTPYEGRVVYVGDAAHATSPQLGQGANLALLDARALAQHANDFAAYAAERRAHTSFYQVASRWLTPFFQSSVFGLGTLRNVAVPIGLWIPWFRRQAVAAMAGTKNGWLRSMPIADVTGYLDE